MIKRISFGTPAALLCSMLLVTLAVAAERAPSVNPSKPNIVFIFCDYLGYGEIQALNPEHGKIKTPAVDKLAGEGMIFTDAHSGSAVCTPTRYGLMTGRYSWRTTLQRGVVQGFKPDWDGGHRVPFIVRWPGHVAPGSSSDQLICLTDFSATASDVIGVESPAVSAEDSVSFLPALSGEEIVSTRAGVIHHSISGHFAYRQGKWKLLLAKGSAGWTGPKENQMPADAPKAQLYDMEADPGETTNLYASHPEVAQRLLAQLEADIFNGRSTEGAPSKNAQTKSQFGKVGSEQKNQVAGLRTALQQSSRVIRWEFRFLTRRSSLSVDGLGGCVV